jgi:DNA-binding transcriptional MerR regulator
MSQHGNTKSGAIGRGRVCFGIGEFSKVTGLSINTLRFYHEKGLLVPDQVDVQTSYRYYGEGSVTRARAIARFKEMLVPLETIGEILGAYDNEATVLEFLVQHRKQIATRIATMQGIVSTLDQIINQEEKVQAMLDSNEFEVERKHVETLLIGSIRWQGKYSECGNALRKLYGELGRYVCGKPMDLYYDEGHKEDGADIETAVPIRKGKQVPGITIRELPGGDAISLIHKGPYELIGHAYEKLNAYAQEQGLSFGPPVRQVYIKGPGFIFKNPKNYLTEVIFLLK